MKRLQIKIFGDWKNVDYWLSGGDIDVSLEGVRWRQEEAPIDNKPECECVKNSSGEWKMYSLNSDGQCIHCGRQISPKPEKIEPIKYSEISQQPKDWNEMAKPFIDKINELIKAVNNLKGE